MGMQTLKKGTTARLLAERTYATATAAVPATIRSYDEAARTQAGGKGDRRKLANNTYLVRREWGKIAVMLHDTDVVTYYPDGSVRFDSGGWRTPTTKERINSYSPATVYQQVGIWLISFGGSTVTFADGMVLTADGVWINPGPDRAELAALRDRIKRYVEEFMERFDVDQVPAPSAFDCWYCLFNSGDNAAAALLSTTTIPTAHLESHMRDRDYVPSLVATAIKRYPVSDVARAYLRAKWHGRDSQVIPTAIERVGRAQVKSSLGKYLRSQMGLAEK